MHNDDTNALHRAIERMPKVELHVHFGGTISNKTIEELAKKNGIDLEQVSASSCSEGSGYGHLIHFLDAFRLRCKCMQTHEDFEMAGADVVSTLRAQNVRYAEITISPVAYRLNSLTMDKVLPGIQAGAKSASGDGEIEVRFILDIGRQFGSDHAWQTVREAIRHQEHGVIAVGLGGDELHYAPEIFAEHFAFVKKEGLHRVAHAGEVAGAASVRGALDALDAERIGHGIGAQGDEALLERMFAHRIPFEVCPTSNLKTGAARSYADHPLPEFLQRGLMVTLNSDDPAMFGSSLTDEYKLCPDKFDMGWEEIRMLCLNGVKASFLPDLDKRSLLEEFEKELFEIEADLKLV